MFDNKYYEEQSFTHIVFESEELRDVIFQDCSFTDCSFRETTFRSCKFIHCTFSTCDLSLILVDYSVFRGVRFEDSKVIGVNWVKASWGKTSAHQLLKSIDFYNCVLNYSTFMGLDLENILIKKCMVKEVDFSETSLKNADGSWSDFENSQFRHTDLTGADFSGAKNYSIKPQLNTLKKTRFSLPEAMSLLYELDIEITEPFGVDKS